MLIKPLAQLDISTAMKRHLKLISATFVRSPEENCAFLDDGSTNDVVSNVMLIMPYQPEFINYKEKLKADFSFNLWKLDRYSYT